MMKTEETVLWQAYKDTLNEEALAALRQVIEDVENHEKINFDDAASVVLAFKWEQTMRGEVFWSDVDRGLYNKAEDGKILPTQREGNIVVDVTPKAIKSDGGSSDYYKISIKTSLGMADVEVNDVIYAMVGGDFDLANVLKAARRMYLASKGCGKEGVDIAYDARKIAWFCDDFQMRFGKEK